MRHLFDLFERFRADERGAFAVIFGLMAIVLFAMAGAVVDFVSLQQARNRAQVALDAATLALQREVFEDDTSAADIATKAQALILERIGDPRISATVDPAKVVINEESGSLYIEAGLVVPTIFVQLVGVDELAATVLSEATRGSLNIEVAVALDITGSMNQTIETSDEDSGEITKIEALQTALQELITLVVQEQQTPTYSKMALVPYSMGVNVGSDADTIRGPVVAPTAITNVAWASGSSIPVSNAERTNPLRITASNHGFQNGDRIYVDENVGGMWQIRNRIFTVSNRAANSFTLQGVNGSNYSSFQSSNPLARVTKCLTTNCELVVTSSAHGLTTNNYAYITGTSGTSQVNNYAWEIGSTTTNTFVLTGSSRTNRNYGSSTSSGSAYCTLPGCEYYIFRNPYNQLRLHRISTCVTERNPDADTDAPPSTTLLGRNYPGSGNPCVANTITPLTSDRAALATIAQNLTASGSTAGHIGVAWAWYLVSPNFNGPWPAASQPAPDNEPNVLKAVVLMTDGEFNSVYCNGVISQSSTSGSGSTSDHINCNAPNGSSYAQAEDLCDAMKDDGILVFTVGFDIVDSQSAQDLMANCASDASRAYEANTGQALVGVFADIGRQLSLLRVTR
ncbi:TadE/TadG family type IV pilus assembly protein [Devosia nitrariae]|uniref:Pilus assembly protein TadG n=1 Tax=Devosia nitrariae TaxID=2071872 RepID=A0ABQ5VZZ1_9HYPH|nr:pilus assembly protein [Devosia nitrariae]GLQ53018.1 pilus assembly protein TadG [Devosia nitrariae]